MPLPLLLIPLALKAVGVAAAAGAGALAASGADKMKDANELLKHTRNKHAENCKKFDTRLAKTNLTIEELGKLELEVQESFERFTLVFDKIKNKPSFEDLNVDNPELPKVKLQEVREASTLAHAFLGTAGGVCSGAVLGTVASMGVKAAVVAFAAASTGTPIAALTGAAATKATLAFLGGGALYAGGGGMALGTAALGAATLGVGLLVGGAIFAVTGSKLQNKADEAYEQVLKNEEKIAKSIIHFDKVATEAHLFKDSIEWVSYIYYDSLNRLEVLVENENDFLKYNERERNLVENTALLVSVLYDMTTTPLLKEIGENGASELNLTGIEEAKGLSDNII